MGDGKELTPEQKAKAKAFFSENPWIGQTHTAKLAKGVIDDRGKQGAGKTNGATGIKR
jgi:hypothetical protein